MEKYQLENPNNARIFIDYRKEKDKVNFEYVGNSSVLKIALHISLLLHLKGLIFLPLMIMFLVMTSVYPAQNLSLINQIALTLFNFIIITVSYIGTTLILTNKRFIKYYPHLNAFGAKKYRALFQSEQVELNKVEIPLFSNVFLDYKATKEFSRYLERVEIIEHPFNRLLVRRNKIKKLPQEFLWKATFYFSKKPKNGWLSVIFH